MFVSECGVERIFCYDSFVCSIWLFCDLHWYIYCVGITIDLQHYQYSTSIECVVILDNSKM